MRKETNELLRGLDTQGQRQRSETHPQPSLSTAKLWVIVISLEYTFIVCNRLTQSKCEGWQCRVDLLRTFYKLTETDLQLQFCMVAHSCVVTCTQTNRNTRRHACLHTYRWHVTHKHTKYSWLATSDDSIFGLPEFSHSFPAVSRLKTSDRDLK